MIRYPNLTVGRRYVLYSKGDLDNLTHRNGRLWLHNGLCDLTPADHVLMAPRVDSDSFEGCVVWCASSIDMDVSASDRIIMQKVLDTGGLLVNIDSMSMPYGAEAIVNVASAMTSSAIIGNIPFRISSIRKDFEILDNFKYNPHVIDIVHAKR